MPDVNSGFSKSEIFWVKLNSKWHELRNRYKAAVVNNHFLLHISECTLNIHSCCSAQTENLVQKINCMSGCTCWKIEILQEIGVQSQNCKHCVRIWKGFKRVLWEQALKFFFNRFCITNCRWYHEGYFNEKIFCLKTFLLFQMLSCTVNQPGPKVPGDIFLSVLTWDWIKGVGCREQNLKVFSKSYS